MFLNARQVNKYPFNKVQKDKTPGWRRRLLEKPVQFRKDGTDCCIGVY